MDKNIFYDEELFFIIRERTMLVVKINNSPIRNQSLEKVAIELARIESIPHFLISSIRTPSLAPSPPGKRIANIPAIVAKGKMAEKIIWL